MGKKMQRKYVMNTLAIILGVGLLAGCSKKTPEAEGMAEEVKEEVSPEDALHARAQALFKPIPDSVEADEKTVELGRALFHDPLLSKDGTISCATCHVIADGGVDGTPTSQGIYDQWGPINSPTVLNSGYHFVQFWDGRAADLQEQAAGPVEDPLEMGDDWDNVVEKLKNNETYARIFADLYEDGVTADNATHAIAEFEKTLITPDAPFDLYLKGDKEALNEQERRGLQAFIDTGCIACHSGKILSSPNYQKMGAIHDYFADRGGEITDADLGRYTVTQDEADKHMFKVPTLRNVELTGPYMHDGKTETLEEAVRMMAWYQLGKELEQNEIDDITAFLKSLTGEIPEVSTDPIPQL